MTKVLITGACGFRFSNFVRKVLYSRSDLRLVSVDKVLNPNTLHNIYVNKQHHFYLGDVADSHFIDTVFSIEKPDYVIHGASQDSPRSLGDPPSFITSNVLGTQVLINACLKYKVNRLIYVSTDKVYGQLTQDDGEKRWDELSPVNPSNPYAASKAAGEFLVKAASAVHGLNYNIIRSCNSFGPRQLPEKLIPKIIKSVTSNQKMSIYGKGQHQREWIHIDDHSDALLTIMDKGLFNQTYNISTGYELSSLEMFQKICNELGSGHDLLSFCADLHGHDFRHASDSSKLRALGWTPKVKFNDGLKQCTNWFLNNAWALR